MRILHTMLRVGDLERSIRFYTDVLGMRVLRRRDVPSQSYTLAFVGYGEESDEAVLELTYNYGVSSYEPGTAFGHVAIEVPDAAAACAAVKAKEFRVFYEKRAGNAPDAYTVDHSAGTYLYDPQGRLRVYVSYGQGPDVFVHDIRELLRATG